MNLFSSQFVGFSFSERAFFCLFGTMGRAILSRRAFVSFAFAPVLCLSRALPLGFSLYVIDHCFVFRAEGVHQYVVPPAPPDCSPSHCMKGIPYPPSLTPSPGWGRGVCVKFDSTFFHVISQMDIIVLLVICNLAPDQCTK